MTDPTFGFACFLTLLTVLAIELLMEEKDDELNTILKMPSGAPPGDWLFLVFMAVSLLPGLLANELLFPRTPWAPRCAVVVQVIGAVTVLLVGYVHSERLQRQAWIRLRLTMIIGAFLTSLYLYLLRLIPHDYRIDSLVFTGRPWNFDDTMLWIWLIVLEMYVSWFPSALYATYLEKNKRTQAANLHKARKRSQRPPPRIESTASRPATDHGDKACIVEDDKGDEVDREDYYFVEWDSESTI